MKKKELKIPVDFNVGDEFWVMKDNKPVAKEVGRIDIKVNINNTLRILYENDGLSYIASEMYHTKQELLDSL